MWEAFEGPYENFDANLVKTHNTEPPTLRLNDPSEVSCPLTWPGREFDQIGTAPSVEQDHCTLIAVKRYRDPHGLVDGIIFYCDLDWSPLTKKLKHVSKK